MTRVAAIDCGTNTIRLLVADLTLTDEALTIEDVTRHGEIVRLGKDVDRTGRLDDAALARTLAVTRAFAAQCERLGVESLRFIATSATRDAAKRDLFAYIEGYYNRQRLHSALGYITPEQAERNAS